MNKYRKYQLARHMYEIGEIKTFRDFEPYLPVSRTAKALRTGRLRMKKLLEIDVSSITIVEQDKLAQLIGIDFETIVELSVRQYQSQRSKKRTRVVKAKR